jgi:glycosyltransferase involved in cell wall biosynthesis
VTLRVAIAKPDWGIIGGFELLTSELASRLEQAGHRVRWLQPRVPDLGARAYGRDVSEAAAAAPEFVRFVQLVEIFESLDLHRAELVVSAMPPAYAVHHPRHIAIFSHHLRCYYDLSDVMIEAGMVADVDAHQRAAAHVHAIDARLLGATPLILATSREVAGRIERFNGLTHNVSVFDAGLGFRGSFPEPSSDDAFEHVLCVSRHEFPKRTELFVQAMNLAPHLDAISVGAGGRLGWARRLDREMATGVRDAGGDGRALWCTDAPWLDPATEAGEGAVRFAGYVEADELDQLYRRALCVVAPAYLEDYGLTAIEAMAYGKPLVVCRDGGNLVNFVEHGVNGLVVEPDGASIAEGVQQLADDPALAERLGKAARELARSYTWDRTMVQFDAAMERVMSR